MSMNRIARVVIATSAMLLTGAGAQAALQLLQFEPTPVSPSLPEFSWTGPGGNFVTGTGTVGNGDGDLAVNAQTPGGIEVDTPLVVAGVPNSTIDGNGTHFFDVTMDLSSATNPADLKDTGALILVAQGQAVQGLSGGSFQMWTTPATDVVGQAPVLLLSGTLTNNSISVGLGGTSAGYQTAQVTYTGGAILNALLAAGGSPAGGSASISLVSLDGPIGVVDQGPLVPGVLDNAAVLPFDANSNGVFDTPAVPEPASMGILLAAGALGLRRRRA
jgi:hypothetical protein